MEAALFVSIDLESVRTAWLGSPYFEFMVELQLCASADQHGASGRFDAALAEMNDAFSAEWGPFAHSPSTADDSFVVLCSGVQDSDQLGRWLVALAQRLEGHDLFGVLRGVA